MKYESSYMKIFPGNLGGGRYVFKAFAYEP